MILVNKDHVIEVTAYTLGRLHGSINIELFPVGKYRKFSLQHAHLYPGRERDLSSYTLLLRCRVLQIHHVISHIRFHVAEGISETLKLISRIYVQIFKMPFTFLLFAVFSIFLSGSSKLVYRINECFSHHSHADVCSKQSDDKKKHYEFC